MCVKENETYKILWDFDVQTDHLILVRWPDPYNNQQPTPPPKKKTSKTVKLAVPADKKVKLRESEKKDKCLDFVNSLQNCGTWKWRLYQL